MSSITVDGVVYGENMIRELQRLRDDCRKAGFITDAQQVRKVLGTLLYTEEGHIISDGAKVRAKHWAKGTGLRAKLHLQDGGFWKETVERGYGSPFVDDSNDPPQVGARV